MKQLHGETIYYFIKNVYGTDTMYLSKKNSEIHDDNFNLAIYRLTGRKTITREDKICLEALGYIFERTFD